MKNKRYKTFEKQSLFAVWNIFVPSKDSLFLKNIIEDRKSKYSATYIKVDSNEKVKEKFKIALNYKFYKKATHNSYAYRILLEDGSILEWKNDDGEIWAGNCILSIMQKENIANAMIIVTRYYGGIHLNNDRFKHLLNASKFIIEKLKNEN